MPNVLGYREQELESGGVVSGAVVNAVAANVPANLAETAYGLREPAQAALAPRRTSAEALLAPRRI